MLLDAREEYPQGLNAAIRTAARPGGSVRRVRPALFGRGAGRGPGGHHGHAGQRAGRVSVRGQAVCARQRAGRRGRHHGRRAHCGGRHGGRRRGLCHARRRNLCARQRGLPRGRAYEGLRHKAAGAGNWRAGGQFSGRISGGRHHCGAEPGHGKQRPAGRFCGMGMYGGKIYLRGKVLVPDLSDRLVCRPATQQDMDAVAPALQAFCGLFGLQQASLYASPFHVLQPNGANPYRQLYTPL